MGNNTHLDLHMDNLYPSAFELPITDKKRIKIYRFLGQRRWLFAPQWKPDKPVGGIEWHYFWTRRATWATFSFDNALRFLGVKPTGLWRVYVFNELTTEIEYQIDMLSKNKPTVRAKRWAEQFGEGRLVVIAPIS